MPIGPVIVEFSCAELGKSERELLRHPLTGGVKLSLCNYQSADELESFIYEIRDAHTAPILILADLEAGDTELLREGFTPLPTLSKYGEFFDNDPDAGTLMADMGGWLMAKELLSIGVDLSLTASLGLQNKDKKMANGISNRNYFHTDPDVVTLLTKAFLHGMWRAGMSSVVRDFPGLHYSYSKGDTKIPTIEHDAEYILQNDIIPFTNLVHSGLSAIIPAHVIYEMLDEMPISYSHFWLMDALREQHDFNGAIISHDLCAPGSEMLGSVAERAMRALDAGCDMLAVSNAGSNQDYSAAMEVLECLNGYETNHSTLRSAQRLLKLCGHFQQTRHELACDDEYLQTQEKIHAFMQKENL